MEGKKKLVTSLAFAFIIISATTIKEKKNQYIQIKLYYGKDAVSDEVSWDINIAWRKKKEK